MLLLVNCLIPASCSHCPPRNKPQTVTPEGWHRFPCCPLSLSGGVRVLRVGLMVPGGSEMLPRHRGHSCHPLSSLLEGPAAGPRHSLPQVTQHQLLTCHGVWGTTVGLSASRGALRTPRCSWKGRGSRGAVRPDSIVSHLRSPGGPTLTRGSSTFCGKIGQLVP